MDLHLIQRRESFQKLTIVHQVIVLEPVDMVQAKRQRHIAMFVVVPVRLAIGSNVNQLRFGIILIESVSQPVGEFFAIVQ